MQLLNKEQTFVKALIYGDSGTGKTSFGVSSPNPLILLSERQGLPSIRESASRLGIANPPALYMSSIDDYREVLFALKGCGPGDTLEIKNNGKVILKMTYPDTVVLDSLTDIGELARMDVERVSPPSPGKDGLPTWTMRHWGALSTKMNQLVMMFRDLPAHVIFLCLKDDKEVGEGSEKSRTVGPSLPMRKLSGTVSAAVNVIGVTHRRTTKEEGKEAKIEYVVMTTGPDYAVTKPYRPLKDVEIPSFSHWITTIRGSHKGPEAKAAVPATKK